ncbi:MAG: ribonuclease E activity regulator RraA [Gammaproteobacteria bacterium]|nr:ribonuclease E activity regulator RraA [Gammaproteobacteria bacterium]
MDVLPDICDEFSDELRVVAPGFRNFGGRSYFKGPVTTIKCFEDNSLVAKAVEEAGEGRVLVVDGGGSMRCGLLGDNLAEKAAANGWQGVIVYGCIRDVDTIGTIDIGVQALATNPLKSVKRDTGLRDEVVTFGGVDFAPGYYVYADNNGIVVAPEELPIS